MVLKQKNRLLAVKTPLGEDVLVLTAFSGHEEISRLFSYELEMISDNNSISAAEIVGKKVTVSIELADGSSRYFNALVSRFVAGDEEHGRRNYRAEAVPWLWFLTRTSDCRIFQNKTVVEIIEQIFQDLGFSDYEISEVKGEHPKRDYCVQYGETDFNFVSRMMEQEGIFYYFRHEDGKHTLVLADQKGAYKDCGESEVDYPRDYGPRAIVDHITKWEHRYQFTPGKWAQTDYNFQDHPARSEPTPSKLMMASEQTLVDLANIEKYEIYEYPGKYSQKAAGETYTKIRMEEEEVEHDVVRGASTCRTFTPGGKFKIKHHRSGSEEGRRFAITAIYHSATEPAAYETGGPVAEGYRNTFTCIPDSVTFRPQRTTPKPVVQGIQTAVVVGPPGEEIWPDKYGRVKVQFFWDREGKRDENSSCWVRASQVYAGKNWGSMCIPRIGQEVIVEFLEGDPDRPIITGRLYNADQMPPFSLPGGKAVSGIKSNSTPGGGGYNEFVLDDTKGKELIRVHGQYDTDTTIEHDLREHVLNDRSRDVANNESITIGNDQTIQIGNNQNTTVGSKQDIKVGADQSLSVGSKQDIKVSADQTLSVGSNQQTTIGAAQTLSVGSNQDNTIGSNQSTAVGGSQSLSVGSNQDITVGQAISITSGTSIKLVVGGSSIEIGPANIKINSAGAVQVKGSVVQIN